MKKIIQTLFFASLSTIFVSCTSIDWGKFQQPTSAESQPIGYYSAGCLAGGQALSLDNPNYLIMNRHRNRYYGHPSLIAYIEQLSEEINKKGLGVQLVGDLAQPRGGPMLTGHASHQVGLDVDVWFRRLSAEQAKAMNEEKLKELDLVYLAKDDEMTSDWNSSYATVLKMAANKSNVERIFINPRIKKELCSMHKGEEWMNKLRPWWGHDEHFHVRLSCPADSFNCRKQTPPPVGDGCDDDLEWWFSDEAKEEAEKRFNSKEKKKAPELPKACSDLAKIK